MNSCILFRYFYSFFFFICYVSLKNHDISRHDIQLYYDTVRPRVRDMLEAEFPAVKIFDSFLTLSKDYRFDTPFSSHLHGLTFFVCVHLTIWTSETSRTYRDICIENGPGYRVANDEGLHPEAIASLGEGATVMPVTEYIDCRGGEGR